MRLPFLSAALAPEVIVSERAHAAILAETHQQHPNETGGILLGHCLGGIWHVIEAIDPGPAARFSPVTFEYDTPYVTHLARKVAACYQRPLQLIGLWHRHPGSFDRFSGDDDITNHRYAQQSPDGAISCLVNLDPDFRITAYHVPADLRYRRLRLHCGDGPLPRALLELRRRSCLQPAALEERRLQHQLRALLHHGNEPNPAGPMAPELAEAIETLLALLEDQQRYAYGLRLQGPSLLVGLVEHGGNGQQMLRLGSGACGEVTIQADGIPDPARFEPERFAGWLAGGLHG